MRRVPVVVVLLTIACARGAPGGEVPARDRLASVAVGADGRTAPPAFVGVAADANAREPVASEPVTSEVAASAGMLAALRSSSAPTTPADSGGRGAGVTRGVGPAGGGARGDSGAVVSRLVPGALADGAVGEAAGFGGLGLRGGGDARGGEASAVTTFGIGSAGGRRRAAVGVSLRGHDAGGRRRGAEVPADLPPLRAGATDDNDDLPAFLKYLAAWDVLPEQVARHCRLDVRAPRHIVVRDLDEQPVPGAAVRVFDPNNGRVLFRGTTYGDGSVPFYPQVFATAGQPARRLLVQAQALGASDVTALTPDTGGPVYVYLPQARPPASTVALDVVFLLDTTGSMQDEIDRIKQTLRQVTGELRRGAQGVDLRYGAVLYRDRDDDFITRRHPLTSDLDAFDAVLRGVEAGGGGDTPESLNQALAEAVHAMPWRRDAARVVFLVADAPPHLDYQDDTPYGETLKDALGQGIRIHSVAASGLDEIGSLVFRQIAQFTRGQFIFIEYGGSVGRSAAAHGVAGQFTSNNLDAIILGRLRWELEHWGRDPEGAVR